MYAPLAVSVFARYGAGEFGPNVVEADSFSSTITNTWRIGGSPPAAAVGSAAIAPPRIASTTVSARATCLTAGLPGRRPAGTRAVRRGAGTGGYARAGTFGARRSRAAAVVHAFETSVCTDSSLANMRLSPSSSMNVQTT